MNRFTKHLTRARCATATPTLRMSSIATALEIKDPYTWEHGRRVAVYAGRLAERVQLPPAAVESIRLGGLLHDIGKIGLSDRVLKNTRNRLPDDLLTEVRLHPLIGVALLRDFDIPAAVIDYVQYHHEKIDGSGYPFGLIRDQIPLGAKIIRVADCFDAITTDRPYQQRKTWIEAVAILRQVSGTDLDPQLVKAFIADVKEIGLVNLHSQSISLYSPSGLAL